MSIVVARASDKSMSSLLLETGIKSDVASALTTTNGPSSGVGNGIGGRTNGLSMEHYTDLVYTAGDLAAMTISNGDFENDAGNDIGTLLNWMSSGGKSFGRKAPPYSFWTRCCSVLR